MNIMQLRRRPVADDVELPDSFSPLLRRLYAARGIQHIQQLERSVRGLLDFRLLHGIEQAVSLLENALRHNKKIVVIGDYDADGATSTALCVLALRSMGGKQIDYLVPNRFDDGYGLSPEVVYQVVEKQAEVIITVDNGISSIAGVLLAQQMGIQVLITDHHLPGEELPAADVIINPNLSVCDFPSKMLAGVGVAFYLMMALRGYLRQISWFSEQQITEPNLAEFLDLVALGTVADVVPLDTNNRILVYQGISRIRAGYCRPGIRALLEIANRDSQRLTASDLGYALGPRLNAAGRLDNMSIGVELLLCQELAQARMLAHDLDSLNQTRRELEGGMKIEAMALCHELEQRNEQLPYGLAIYHPEWHQGIVGILASRIKDHFYRPVIAFAPAGEGIIKGSGRSIAGLHMRDALERLDSLNPGLLLRFGGHAMAAGLSLREERFTDFQRKFAELVGEWVDPEELNGVVWSDGELATQELTLEIAAQLRDAGPWGQGFSEPLFDGKFRILQQRIVGEKHLKLLLEPIQGGALLDGIAFNIDTSIWPDNSIKQATLAYQLDVNEFRGNQSLQLLIQHIWPD